MGVELGKVLAKNILAQLDKPEDVSGHDSSVCTLQNAWQLVLICLFDRQRASSTTIRSTGRSDSLPSVHDSNNLNVRWYGSLNACRRNDLHCHHVTFALQYLTSLRLFAKCLMQQPGMYWHDASAHILV